MDYRVIKENDLFLLTDISGDIPENAIQGLGLYTKDTRFLSLMELKINGERPVVLASEADQNYISQIVLTNPHKEVDGKQILWRESVELERTRFIYKDVLYESVKATNFNPHAESFEVSMRFDADFNDMFIVRGFQTGEVGSKTPAVYESTGMSLGYDGKDGISRSLTVEWSEPATSIAEDGTIAFQMSLHAGESKVIDFALMPVIDGQQPKRYSQQEALAELHASYANWQEQSTAVETDLPLFDALYNRGLQDIRVLMTDLGYGNFPVAGLPWFAVPFGRDSLIAALQLLPIQPEVAKGTLLTMAQYQGEHLDSWRDEQPGKIMHELRSGELANTNQIPFTPYYGTIDATPLFLVLLGEYVKWTGDVETFLHLVPNVKRALTWIDEYGDRDGNRFVEYHQESSKGIANQGWKDSSNSVVHRSGEYAKSPIALVEVQGYVYQAKTSLVTLLRSLPATEGEDWTKWAAELEAEAEDLRVRFEDEFWMEDEQFYAIALDHENKQVQSVTSNPGHVLMAGMLAPERAAAVAKKLVSPELFSGYGIRTMAVGDIGYNPMSYHNGSIWPHDNSMCLLGLSSQGFHEEAGIVMEGLLSAAEHFENYRLPELFCGYSDDRGKPVHYPVACSPQAWAAGTPLVFVQAMLGLQFDPANLSLSLAPSLPVGMNQMKVSRMRLGEGFLDLTVERQEKEYVITIHSNSSNWQINDQPKSVLAHS